MVGVLNTLTTDTFLTEMIDIQLTEDELNTLLHGLYVLEDQYWFKGHDLTEPLIVKLNKLLPKDTEEN